MSLPIEPQWVSHSRRTLRRLFDEVLADVLANMAWNG